MAWRPRGGRFPTPARGSARGRGCRPAAAPGWRFVPAGPTPGCGERRARPAASRGGPAAGTRLLPEGYGRRPWGLPAPGLPPGAEGSGARASEPRNPAAPCLRGRGDTGRQVRRPRRGRVLGAPGDRGQRPHLRRAERGSAFPPNKGAAPRGWPGKGREGAEVHPAGRAGRRGRGRGPEPLCERVCVAARE